MKEVLTEQLRDLRRKHELIGLDESELFEAFAANCVLHRYHERSDFTPELHRTGGGNDLGADAWGVVVNGALHNDLDGVRQAVEGAKELNTVVVVVQAKTSESAEGKVVADLADNLRQICDREPIRYTASERVKELQAALHVLYDARHLNMTGSPRLEAWYVHCGGDPNADLVEKCRSGERTLGELARFDSVRFEVAGFHRLQRLHQLSNRRVRASFNWSSKSGMAKMDGVNQAWTGTLPAADLVDRILTDEGGSIRHFLFHDNIRDFLGEAKEVNQDIAATLADEVVRKRFAVMNNGITIIARRFDATGQECTLSDFQIVNGCQTGYVLFHQREHLTEDVQVKLTVIETESEEIAETITNATNRQTPIAYESLGTGQQIHREIEAYFDTTKPQRHLHYERRTGQFDFDGSITKTRVISQNQLTQSYAAVFLDRAHDATRPAKLRKDKRLVVYRSDVPSIAYYTAASVRYQVDWLFRNNRVDRAWKPARFLLMAAAVRRLSEGRPPPKSPRKTKQYCEKVLDRIWDRDVIERCVEALIPELARHRKNEAPDHRLAEAVRTKGFTDRFLRAVQESH